MKLFGFTCGSCEAFNRFSGGGVAVDVVAVDVVVVVVAELAGGDKGVLVFEDVSGDSVLLGDFVKTNTRQIRRIKERAERAIMIFSCIAFCCWRLLALISAMEDALTGGSGLADAADALSNSSCEKSISSASKPLEPCCGTNDASIGLNSVAIFCL